MIIIKHTLTMLLLLTLIMSIPSSAVSADRNTKTVVSPEMESGPNDIVNHQLPRQTLSGSQIYTKVKSSSVTILTEKAIGSGFIVSDHGYILTNWHVVFNPKSFDFSKHIQIKQVDSRIYPAQIIKTDPEVDIALLKIDGDGYPPVQIGDANSLQVGDPLYIIGAPKGLEHSMTNGIVSGFNRDKGRIQTSAIIHQGNSGGPVFNDKGEVVAICVSAELSDGEAWVQLKQDQKPVRVSTLLDGISYLIPINHARNLLNLAR